MSSFLDKNEYKDKIIKGIPSIYIYTHITTVCKPILCMQPVNKFHLK